MTSAETSQEGDAASLTARAKRLLASPATAQEGAGLLATAAEKGGAEAAALIAVLIGVGALAREDWLAALDYLQISAEQGWKPARAQLALLGADPDPVALTSPPPMRVVSQAPHIAVAEKFIPPQFCDWMIERARPRIAPARVFDKATGTSQIDPARSNSAVDFNFFETDLILLLIRARIAAACKMAPRMLEDTNVLHYAVGQQFNRHFDFLDPANPGFAAEIAANGQRVATFLVYLNDGFEGAETDFPAIGWRYRGGKGDALFFMNVEPSGAPDRRTLHAGLAPTRGEKWLLSQWIRGRA